MIDTDKYEGHTITHWCARNVGDGGESCDNDYEHDEPFIETDDGKGENPAIGYFNGGRTAHPLEEKRANIRLLADAPLLLEEVKRLRELFSIDEGSRDEGYCVTMRLEGCEYIGTLRLYKDEEDSDDTHPIYQLFTEEEE